MVNTTPGPWRIGVVRNNSATVVGEGIEYVATLMRKPGWGDLEANALLIIAAPDMLEALEMAVEAIGNSDAKFCCEAAAKAQAAIAKARGKGIKDA